VVLLQLFERAENTVRNGQLRKGIRAGERDSSLEATDLKGWKDEGCTRPKSRIRAYQKAGEKTRSDDEALFCSKFCFVGGITLSL
jgi:hypothetical protein